MADPFAPDLVEPLLPPDHPFRGRIRIVAQATSTQDLARQSAELPSVWAAEIQTAGRGRQGHPWISDHPGGLWCSVLWEPREKSFSLLSILGSLAAELFESGDEFVTFTPVVFTARWQQRSQRHTG